MRAAKTNRRYRFPDQCGVSKIRSLIRSSFRASWRKQARPGIQEFQTNEYRPAPGGRARAGTLAVITLFEQGF